MLAAVMVAGCATTQKSYQTTTAVSPAGQPQQYMVEFKIRETGEDGKQNVLSAPRVTVKAGQEGQIKVCGEKEENGVFCTALVKETANGVEVHTTVTVKEDGTKVLNTLQKTVVTK